jgi:hypothetical protein
VPLVLAVGGVGLLFGAGCRLTTSDQVMRPETIQQGQGDSAVGAQPVPADASGDETDEALDTTPIVIP